MCGCESWTMKKAEHRRIDAFELWFGEDSWVPWTTRRSNQSILKEINPEYSLERLMLKLILQYFGHLMWRTNLFEMTLMLGSQRVRHDWATELNLQPHGLQQARLPCLHRVPEFAQIHVHWVNGCRTSSHLILCFPFSCPLSLLTSGSFPISQLFTSGGQSIGASASESVPQWIFRIDFLQNWWVSSPCCSRNSQEFSPAPQFKSIYSSALSLLHSPTLTSVHDYGKTIPLTRWTLAGKVMSLLFNMLSSLVITFLPRSKRLLISWLQSPSPVILEPKKVKSDNVSTVSPSISHEVMGQDAMILVFWMLALSQLFHCPLSLSSRGFWVPLHFLP